MKNRQTLQKRSVKVLKHNIKSISREYKKEFIETFIWYMLFRRHYHRKHVIQVSSLAEGTKINEFGSRTMDFTTTQ